MKKDDFILRIKSHEVRLLSAGALLGLALRSKSNKGRFVLGLTGVILALGDIVTVKKAPADKLINDWEKTVRAFLTKHFPDVTFPEN